MTPSRMNNNHNLLQSINWLSALRVTNRLGLLPHNQSILFCQKYLGIFFFYLLSPSIEVYTEVNVTERPALRHTSATSSILTRAHPAQNTISGIESLPKQYKAVICIHRATNEPIAADRCWGSSSPLSTLTKMLV